MGYAHNGWSVSGTGGLDFAAGSNHPIASLASSRDLGKAHLGLEAVVAGLVPWTHEARHAVGLLTGAEIKDSALAIGVYYQADPAGEVEGGPGLTAGWQLPW